MSSLLGAMNPWLIVPMAGAIARVGSGGSEERKAWDQSMADLTYMDWRKSGVGSPRGHAGPDGETPNAVLRSLPDNTRSSVLASARVVEFAPGELLRQAGDSLHCVHFIRSGLVSICGGEDGAGVEVASVGNEGLIGVPSILGAPAADHAAIAVSACVADAVDVEVLGMLMAEHPELGRAMLAYANAGLEQVIRLSVCNVRHRLEQRLARWILAAHARLGPERIVVTHRDLARLLGVRRASVTEVLHLIEGHGAIRSHRGYVTVRDAGKLAELSCACHRLPPAAAQA